MKNRGSQALRFLGAGAFNTAVTGLLLSLLALFLHPQIAYAIVFGIGIALSVVLAGKFVFRQRLTWSRVIAYVVAYLVVFCVGLGALEIMQRMGVPNGASGVVVLLTAPLSFFAGRFIFANKETSDQRTKPE